MKFNWVILLIILPILGCNPIVESSYLYSSSSLTEKITPFMENINHHGLQDDTLQYLFDSMSCPNFESQIWYHIYFTLFENSPPPPSILVQKKIQNYAGDYLIIRGATQPNMVRAFSSEFSDFYRKAFRFFADKPEQVILEQLADIEYLGDLSNGEANDYIDIQVVRFVQDALLIFKNIKEIIRPLNLTCSNTNFPHPKNNTDIPLLNKNSLHPIVYGARKVMATAYQSCEVLSLDLVSPENYNGVEGVSKTSQSGKTVRSISSLESLNSTHYYWRSSYPSSKKCLDLSKNPLIYDYGGKPSIETRFYPTINLFKNAGSGSRALGLDCSGFVLSSLASAGLRVQENKPIGPFQISGISSWNFLDHATKFQQRLSCFRKVHAGYPDPIILPGDIIASKGHVLIVDEISDDDPLGLFKIKSSSQCHYSKISPNNFHFSVIQSSSSFNGIGINRMHIQNTNNPPLINGLKRLASHLCYKKFKKQIPNNDLGISILRHLQNSKCTESEMYIKGQECLSSCPA